MTAKAVFRLKLLSSTVAHCDLLLPALGVHPATPRMLLLPEFHISSWFFYFLCCKTQWDIYGDQSGARDEDMTQVQVTPSPLNGQPFLTAGLLQRAPQGPQCSKQESPTEPGPAGRYPRWEEAPSRARICFQAAREPSPVCLMRKHTTFVNCLCLQTSLAKKSPTRPWIGTPRDQRWRSQLL